MNKGSSFPLTALQQSYFIGENDYFSLNGNAFVYLEHKINCSWDEKNFSLALKEIFLKHKILGMQILSDGLGKIRELDLRDVIAVKELTTESENEIEIYLKSIRNKFIFSPPSIKKFPLFRLEISVFKNKFLIHFIGHLILFDAYSTYIFLKELSEKIYNKEKEIKKLAFEFHDYLFYLNSLKEKKSYQRSLDYWKNRLDNLPGAPDLYLLKSPNLGMKSKMKRKQGGLDEPDWKKLKNKIIQHKLTLNMAVCSAFCEIIAKWSNTNHFIITLLHSNRYPIHPDIFHLIGNCSSISILEVDFRDKDTFLDRVKHLQNQSFKDMAHLSVSGVDVIRELNKIRGGQITAVSPIVFTSTIGLYEQQDDFFSENKIDFSYIQTPFMWIDHQIYEQNGKLCFNIDYVENLFCDDMLDDMLNTYRSLLKELANSDEIWTKVRNFSLPDAQKKIHASINQTKQFLPTGLLHVPFFDYRLYEDLNHIALISDQFSLTYKELSERARTIGECLKERGIKPNTVIAIFLEKGWEQIAAILGILWAGAVYLPLDINTPINRIDFILKKSDSKFILSKSNLSDKLKYLTDLTIIQTDIDIRMNKIVENDRINFLQSQFDLAYILFTSGSTGTPKGVMIAHKSASNTILDIIKKFNISNKDIVLALSSYTFDLSVFDIFGLLTAGGALVLPKEADLRDPESWLRIIMKYQVTIWNTVPTLMQMFVEYLEHQSNIVPAETSLRLILLSGDWIPKSLASRIKAIFPQAILVSLGGATEASIWSNYYLIDKVEDSWPSIPYGFPLANQQMYILDAAMQHCPTWVKGDLYIAGDGLADGYLNDLDKTNQSFLNHKDLGIRLYKTGDQARYWQDGTIEFLGRKDFQIKFNGYRIELGEIESVLLQHPKVQRAVVKIDNPVDDKYKNIPKKIVAYIVGNFSTEDISGDLRDFLETKLMPYMIPSEYILLESFPLTNSGKIDRHSLRIPDNRNKTETSSCKRPMTKTEKKLVQIWKNLFVNCNIGVADNFFDLGGDSLLAIRLVNDIEKSFKIRIPLSILFEYGNIINLALYLENSDKKIENSLVTIKSNGEEEPLFFVHPIGGSVFCYHKLAFLLKEFPFYAIQSPGLNGNLFDMTIEEMAKNYLTLIKTKKNHGPYRLGGWSFGGIVAYEIAQQLISLGEEVSHLFLIDPYFCEDYDNAYNKIKHLDDSGKWMLFFNDLIYQSDLNINMKSIAKIPDDISISKYYLELAIQYKLLPPDFDQKNLELLYQIFLRNCSAYYVYKPWQYAGNIDLFRATKYLRNGNNPNAKWLELAKNITIHNIEADHYSLLKDNALNILAEKIHQSLYLPQVEIEQ